MYAVSTVAKFIIIFCIHSEEIRYYKVIIFTPFFSTQYFDNCQIPRHFKTICSLIRDSKQSDDLVKKNILSNLQQINTF